jgi:hypothetical protein
MWLFPYGQFKIPLAFDSWVWPLLGLIFLPWTTLTYTIIFPITGFDWLWLVFSLLADVLMYVASARRQDVPYYSGY